MADNKTEKTDTATAEKSPQEGKNPAQPRALVRFALMGGDRSSALEQCGMGGQWRT